jgi:DNA-binding response OmpR family regulator
MDILIIDDDAPVRAGYAKLLQAAGFRVTQAASVDDAFREVGQRDFKAVLCDFVLPTMDGTTFHAALSQRAPAVADRIIFVTGWMNDPKARLLLEHTGRPVLIKPVESVDLVDAVRRTVDEA